MFVISPVTIMRSGSSGERVTAKVVGRGAYTLGIGAPYAMMGLSVKDCSTS